MGKDKDENKYNYIQTVCGQLVLGAIYYFLVVQKYRPLPFGEPTPAAVAHQSINEVKACCENSCAVNFHSACCWAGRAAHTYDKIGLLSYWPGMLLTALCPCLTLCYMNSFTELKKKLGGEKRGIPMAAICSCFCSCCM